MPHSPAIRFAPFTGLGGAELHDILKLRFDVFVLEQQSLYPEIDGQDPDATHMIVDSGGVIVGTTRILNLIGGATNTTGDAITIGRVAIAKPYRGQGLGRRMVQAALEHIAKTAADRPVTLGAQLHLEAFYASLGFQRVSEIYDDGGIPHVDMTRPAQSDAI